MVELAKPGEGLSYEELQLATRNRGMPLEGLRYDITPTGMHYLLIHFDIPGIDSANWSMRLGGNVDRPMELTLDEITSRPRTTLPVTLECAGNGRARLDPRPMAQPWLVEAIGTAEWTGASLAGLLDDAGVKEGTCEILFTGADRGIQGDVEHVYQRSLPLGETSRSEVLLAYEMNGRPLEPQHGSPLRLVVPGWYGMTSVKWLMSIDALTEPFRGYQQTPAYHLKQTEDDPGEPVTRMKVRALMVPPGIPEFFTRRRLVDSGVQLIEGRAWSGASAVARVQVGVNDRWAEAKLADPIGDWAWRGWSYQWAAEPGEYELSCRATDTSGDSQPLTQRWNLQGMANNMVQRVAVTVR